MREHLAEDFPLLCVRILRFINDEVLEATAEFFTDDTAINRSQQARSITNQRVVHRILSELLVDQDNGFLNDVKDFVEQRSI